MGALAVGLSITRYRYISANLIRLASLAPMRPSVGWTRPNEIDRLHLVCSLSYSDSKHFYVQVCYPRFRFLRTCSSLFSDMKLANRVPTMSVATATCLRATSALGGITTFI